jgi:hypothetical protein
MKTATPRKAKKSAPISALKWKWAGHLSGELCITQYRCEKYKANCKKWCNRREGNGPLGYEYFGGGTIYYFDGEKREYKTQKQLIAAIEKRLHREK